jgi:hypothetical protein
MAIAISPVWISYTIFARRKAAGTPNLVRRALSLSAQGGGAKRRDGFGERSTAHRHYADRNEGEPGGTPGSASRDSVPAAHAAVEIHSGPTIFNHANGFPAAEAIDIPQQRGAALDQDTGYWEAYGGNTVTSALVLAGLI